MANIWNEQNQVKQNPNRNNFDLSFQNHLTMKMGTLYPVFCKPVVPGDSFRIESAFGLKFMPLVFPVQSKMRAHMHFFYVRNKNLWSDFEDWVTGLKGAAERVVPPYIVQPSSFYKTGSLADYLGVPTTFVGVDPVEQKILHPLAFYNNSGTIINIADVRYFAATSLEGVALNSGTSIVNLASAPSTAGSVYFISAPLVPQFSEVDFTNYKIYMPNLKATRLSSYSYFTVAERTGDTYIRVSGTPVVTATYATAGGSFTLSNGTGSANTLAKFQQYVQDKIAAGVELVFVFSAAYGNATSSGALVTSPADYQVYDPKYSFIHYYAGEQKVTDISTLSTNVFSDTSNGMQVSALPFRAYESIYNAYYRNSHGVDPFRINGQIEYNKFNTTTAGGQDTTPYKLEQRNYELDFLTSCLPSPQAGPAPLVGMSALGNITLEDENGITTAKAELDSSGNITKIAVTSPLASTDHARTLMNMAAVGMNINDFRQTNALQRHLEQTLRSGYRYIDFIEGHFGVKPEYKELDMAEFIGGFSRDVNVSQILQTTDTEPLVESGGSPLGAFAGNASAFGGSEHEISHHCDDFGYIIGILCVTPTPAYSQLLPKHFLYRDRLDYYFSEFANIGMQPVTYEEVCPVQRYMESSGGVSLTDTFGYQRPNYDLVSSVDEVHGNFRTDLRDFLINRRFAISPQLSPSFIKIDPSETNDVFAQRTPDDDTIVGQIVFRVYAKRPIPRVVIPSLGR